MAYPPFLVSIPDRGDRAWFLREIERGRGLSMRELAEAGVSYAYISRIEAGARQPSVRVLRRLARRLGVSPEYLETGVDLGPAESREMRLRDAELELRLAETTAGAEASLAAILAEAEADGDARSAARARAGLGLAALRRGEYGRAIAELEAVVASGAVTPASQPEIYGLLGRAYADAGDPERAVALFEECLACLDPDHPAQSTTSARFAIYLSYALADAGDLGRAREVLAPVLDRADEVVDPYMRVRLYWSQARLAAQSHDPRTALDNLRRAVALLEASEDTRQLGRAHLLWAEILIGEGRAEEARPHLELAERCLGSVPDHEDLCWLRTQQARQAASSGRFDEAVACAREAVQLLGQGDPRERAKAHWALACALAGRGEMEQADAAFRRAFALFTRTRSQGEAAQVCRDWARALEAAGRGEAASEILAEAVELERALGDAAAPSGRATG
jgi:tetratricopeptide (TPR) repeat protein